MRHAAASGAQRDEQALAGWLVVVGAAAGRLAVANVLAGSPGAMPAAAAGVCSQAERALALKT